MKWITKVILFIDLFFVGCEIKSISEICFIQNSQFLFLRMVHLAGMALYESGYHSASIIH